MECGCGRSAVANKYVHILILVKSLGKGWTNIMFYGRGTSSWTIGWLFGSSSPMSNSANGEARVSTGLEVKNRSLARKSLLRNFLIAGKHPHNSLSSCCCSLLVRKKSSQTTRCQPQWINPYPTAFPYGNGMVLHIYQQQESSTTKTVHKVINKRLKTYV